MSIHRGISRRIVAAGLAGLCALSMTACGGSSTEKSSDSPSASASTAARTVTSCQEKLSFTDAPKRVFMMGDTDAPVLARLGLLDKVVARAGDLRESAYDKETLAKLKAIPTVNAEKLETGGAKVSTETILDQHPDLVVGYDSGADRAALRKAGVKFYSPDAWCEKSSVTHADFSLVTKEVDKIATIFDVQDKAKTVNASLKKDIAKVEASSKSESGKKVNAAALYITNGSTTFYTYGTSSMVEPIFQANGLRNMYDSKTERVFDASMEDVLSKNPEWIVLLAGDADMSQAEPTFMSFKGAKQLDAVKKGHVVTMAFSLTDPPTPASIDGAIKLHELMSAKK